MEYLPLFLLLAAALIAGWFYLQRAKGRDAATPDSTTTPASSDAPATTPADEPHS